MENVKNNEEVINPLKVEYAEEYFNSFENYRTNLVTVIAYLIGVADETISNASIFDDQTYNELKADNDAGIIRALCKIRNRLFLNYTEINNLRKQLVPLDKMSEYIDAAEISFLRKNDIDITNAYGNSSNVTFNIAVINQYIVDRIDKIKKFIPDWVKYEYVRCLFLMPGCYAGHNGINLKGKNPQAILKKIHEIRGAYLYQKVFCPYQAFIMWPRPLAAEDGNVLFNDAKFLKMLYGANKDCFAACEYVIDAEQCEKDNIYEFVADATNVAVFVDCENVDPFCFAATIANLDANNMSKIKKVVLYDDVNTSTAWDHISSIIDIPIVKHDLNRLLDNKSLVDVTMTAGVCEAYYRENVESIILVSSDSDFWGLIRGLPTARFLVLNESNKTSRVVNDKLDEHEIKHCFMDKFAQDKVQEFKNKVLYRGLHAKMERFNKTGNFMPMNVDELINEIFFDAYIIGSELQIKKEKTDFYNKYLKNGFVVRPVEEDGRMRFHIEICKK